MEVDALNIRNISRSPEFRSTAKNFFVIMPNLNYGANLNLIEASVPVGMMGFETGMKTGMKTADPKKGYFQS